MTRSGCLGVKNAFFMKEPLSEFEKEHLLRLFPIGKWRGPMALLLRKLRQFRFQRGHPLLQFAEAVHI